MKLIKTEALLDEDTGERYFIDNLVSVQLNSEGAYDNIFVGRIIEIEEDELTLDTSEQFRSRTVSFKLDTICKMQLLF